MMTLILAAAAVAQPAPPADAHAGMQAGQQQGMKKDCCKDGCACCKDMAKEHEGHGTEHGGQSAH